MDTKFKPGDRVVTVTSRDDILLRIGMTGTVLNHNQTIFEDRPIVTILLDHNNKKVAGYEYRFELIEKTEVKA